MLLSVSLKRAWVLLYTFFLAFAATTIIWGIKMCLTNKRKSLHANLRNTAHQAITHALPNPNIYMHMRVWYIHAAQAIKQWIHQPLPFLRARLLERAMMQYFSLSLRRSSLEKRFWMLRCSDSWARRHFAFIACSQGVCWGYKWSRICLIIAPKSYIRTICEQDTRAYTVQPR